MLTVDVLIVVATLCNDAATLGVSSTVKSVTLGVGESLVDTVVAISDLVVVASVFFFDFSLNISSRLVFVQSRLKPYVQPLH